MTVHTLDIDKFRTIFPAFADPVLYPPDMLNFWFAMATCELSATDSCVLHGDCLDNALMLCVAHIGTLLTRAAQGQAQTGAVTSAAIDKVSVGFTAPPFKDGWDYWLSLTPYGLQLHALLSSRAVGGFYFGGLPETAALRRVGGVYR